MRDPGRTPVINRDVHACNLRKPNCARFPVRREIGLGAVIAIPHVVDGDLIAVDPGPCSLCDVRLPRTIVAGLQGKPPQDHNRECTKDDRKFQQFSATKYDDRQDSQEERNRGERARLWKIKIEGSNCPCCANESRQPYESPEYGFDHTHAKTVKRRFASHYCEGTASAGHSSSVAFQVLSGLKRSRATNFFSVSGPRSFS